ncbi:transcriptional regulator [Actinoplanes sp. TRM 88003]|uniref:Transcriptional regulator n=1 Tax=Paractinoplanes aksuensis TaxID=2939490 RepID=A0ABT1E1K9_9ACTN|nr:transcriptional regulator [Actinoplanes aksuensis]MCO8277023.1 transcriptional regulator [Actinoplanes aksuensis]
MSDVLHVLRCTGFAELARVADAAGLSEAETESGLIDLAVDGLVTREMGAWGLTAAGTAEDLRRTAAELAAAGTEGLVGSAYEKFMVLNPELLDLCSAWQMRSVDGVPTPNDHRDTAYDTKVLELFGDLDRRAEEVCAELAKALPRFGRYRHRLGAALERARGGAREELADSMTSYHVVWFQLHEDLLVTLGRPRG